MEKLALLLLDKAAEQAAYANAALCIAISYTEGHIKIDLERARDRLVAAETIIRSYTKPF